MKGNKVTIFWSTMTTNHLLIFKRRS